MAKSRKVWYEGLRWIEKRAQKIPENFRIHSETVCQGCQFDK